MASATIKKLPFTKLDSLWTNPASTSSFAAQDVNVDLDGYDLVAIKLRYTSSATSVIVPLMFYPVRDGQAYYMPIISDSSNLTGGRGFTYNATDKTIQFTKGQYNAKEDNSRLIPLEIYGVKL